MKSFGLVCLSCFLVGLIPLSGQAVQVPAISDNILEATGEIERVEDETSIIEDESSIIYLRKMYPGSDSIYQLEKFYVSRDAKFIGVNEHYELGDLFPGTQLTLRYHRTSGQRNIVYEIWVDE